MITLTTPPSVNTVLGGATTIPYPKLVVGPFTMDPATPANGIRAAFYISSPANPTQNPVPGALSINQTTGELIMEASQIGFFRRVILTAPQLAGVLTIVQNAQNGLEAGLISLGVVAGAQSPGA